MSRRLPRLVPLAGLLALSQSVHAADFSGSATVTSDYVFRGVSQSNEHGALQGGMRADTSAGYYASVWASWVDFAGSPDASAEVDYIIGVRRKLGGKWVGELNATWFTYTQASELNYLEWIASATWRDRAWLLLGASSDVFATGHTGIYTQAGVRIPIDQAARLELAGGYYRLERAYARDYAHAQATLAWLPHPQIELRLTGHLTTHDTHVLFDDLAGPRLEAAVQASF